jgi:alpha-tubulin suppressor-like RCC1 family protein
MNTFLYRSRSSPSRFAHSMHPSLVRLRACWYGAIGLLCLVPAFQGWAASCAAPPAGLVSWWRAETNAMDQAGTNNGTIHGGVTIGSGRVGQSFVLDGTSGYVEVPSSPGLKLAGSFTVEGWVNYTYLNSPYGSVIFVKGQDIEEFADIALSITIGAKLRPHVNVPGGWSYFDCNTLLTNGVWYHVAMVYDGTSLRGYVNGALDGTLPVSGPVQTTDYPVRIGAYAPINGNPSKDFFPGKIDELSVYNRALTGVEIQTIYNAGTAGKCTAPTAPVILSAPTNQMAAVGSALSFNIIATGAAPLSYQWRLNGTNVAGASSSTLTWPSLQLSNAGYYSVRVTNTSGSVTSLVAALVVFQPVTNPLINVDFDAGPTNNSSLEAGPAAAGQAANDFWNFYTRDNGSGGYRSFGVLSNLKLASGVASGVGLTITNAPGAYPNGSSDPMYNVYVYPLDTGNAIVTVTNLPAGLYDFYVYANDGNYQLQVGATNYGSRTALDVPLVSPPVWQEGRQYALFRSVLVGAGQAVTLTVRPGQFGYAIISGLQIATAGLPPSIAAQPQSQAVSAGASIVFSVNASGTAPLSYQWQRNGTNLAAATDSNLALPNVQPSDAGSYAVLVSNIAGTLRSSNAVLTVNPPPLCVTPPLGLVSWWRAESNTLDFTGLDNGTVVGGVSYVPGKVGQAFSFNGTDGEIRLGSGAGNFGTNDFTIEFWIQTSSTRALESVLGKRPACNGDSTGFWDMRISNGRLAMALMAPGVIDYNQINATRQINDGVYHHVAFVRQGTSGTLYIDGTYEAAGSTPGATYLSTSGNFVIGRSACVGVDGSQYLTGQLDEIAVYQQALSLSQVQAIYHAGSAGKCVPANMIYDAAAGFSPTSNPAPPWSYGYSVTLGSPMVMNPEHLQVVPGIDEWRTNIWLGAPTVFHNSTSLAITNGTDVFGPGVLGSHPGPNGEYSLIRFTAPSAGRYEVSASFSGLDTQSTTTDVHVLTNGVSVFDGAVNGFGAGSGPTFNTTVTLNAGGYLDFAVGRGADGDFGFDATALSIQVTPVLFPDGCVTPPAGLVSWWRGDNSTADAAGGNSGTVAGYGTFGYAPGVVGQAFVFDGIHRDRVDLGNPASLQLQDMTVEAWIKRANLTDISLDDLNQDGAVSGEGGVVFGYGRNGYGFGLLNNGQMFLSRIDVDGVLSAGVVTDTNWHHVAVTKSGATTVFYLDGVPASAPLFYATTNTFDTSAAIGSRGDARGGTFWGMVDEPSVYGRALSGAEVQGVYQAGAAGKCVTSTPPAIPVQPTNQVATVGDNISFSVLATGSWPLSYQWRFNGTNLNAATASSLVLTNVQLAAAGSYSVLISNSAGTLLSSNAILTVNPPPPCAAPSLGLVSWWRAEGNVLDFAGANNGAQVNALAFVPGRVGQAFGFDGSSAYISMPASASLDVGAGGGMTLECWVNPASLASEQALAEWNNGAQPGAHFWISVSPPYGGGTGSIYINLIDTAGTYHPLSSAAGVVQPNGFQHVAMTYDQASGMASLYYNGGLVASQTLGSFVPQTSYAFYLGKRTGPYPIGQLGGALDEMALYNRALGAPEIQAIYLAERSGKCTSPTAPAVLLPPTNLTVTAQSNAVFNVLATGTSPLAYQWRLNAAELPGETNSTLALSAVRANQAGSYDVVITNAIGTVTSAVAVLTVYVPPPPVFTLQPQSQTAPASTNVTFTALATDTWPVTYQWYFTGTALAGANSTNLDLTNIQAANGGDYTVVAANPWSTATSAVATLTVVPIAPFLTLQPQSAGVFNGFAAQLSVAAMGTEPIGYQWQLYGTNIPGATNASYIVSNMLPANAGLYRAIVSSSAGSTNSAEALLALVPVACWGSTPIGLTSLPVALTNAVAVAAGAQHNLALRRDGTVVAWGAAGLTNVPPGLSNVVAISAGGDHSLALKADGNVVAWGQTNSTGQTNVPNSLSNVVAIAAGGTFNLALKADGTVVGWGLNTSGETNVPAGLTNVVAISAGSGFGVALRADGRVFAWGNSAGKTNVPANLADVVAVAAGSAFTLALRSDGTVAAWGSSSYGPTNVPAGLANVIAIGAGSYHSLAVKGDGTLLAWGAGTNQVASTYPNLGQSFIPPSVTNLTAASAGDAHTLVLAGDGPPFITAPPVSRVSYSARRVVFRAAATGARPLSYQWQLNGVDLPGATGPLLVLDSARNAGDYRVVVTNQLGTATSSAATLTLVDSAPFVITQPVSQPVFLGAQASLQVTADGSGPFSYQWRLNGTNIAGATGSSLFLNHLLLSQAGNYSVVVSNAFGAVSSAKAAVPVVQATAWGAGTNSVIKTPEYGQSIVPAGLNNAVALAGGGYHALAVKADGKVLAWGAGTSNYVTPNFGQSVVPANLPAVAGVAGGLYHSLAVRADGMVAAWGAGLTNPLTYQSPHYGQSVVPAGLSNVTAVAAGDYSSVALKRDGTVAAWGYPPPMTNVPTTVTNVIAIASRASHALALRSDGSVVHWGTLTTLPPTPYNYVAVAVGVNHCLALRNDGTVVSWGGQYAVPPGLSNVVDIAAGYDHSVALKNDGTVVTWGATNTYGRNLIPPGLTNVIGIACGYYNSLAFLGDGSPLIKFPPVSRAAYLGTQTNFSVLAVGAQRLGYQWQFNGADIPGATNASVTLNNLRATDAGSYRVIVTNVFGSVTSAVATLTTPVPLGQALNATGLVWSTSGNAAWFGESVVTHDGANAAQSGLITDSQSSTVQATVAGAGTLSFWWKVSSEEWFDYLSFYIDGIQQATISGEKDWQMQTFTVTNGSHTLRWTYAKDLSVSDGADAGWLDQVTFVTNPPVITLQPLSQHGSMGALLGLSVAATGAPPLSYQWVKDGTILAGATAPNLTALSATRRDSGVYQVLVSNPGGSTPSSNATLVVRSPQKMGPPLRLPGEALVFTSGDADGGFLLPGDLPNFQVQATTNFVDWIALPNCLTLTNGTLLLVDPDRANYPRRFYRIIELDDATMVTSPPAITTQPLSQALLMGGSVTLSVSALGAPPLKYQWFKDGTNMAGVTSASLVMVNATRHHSGLYVVVVSNPVGGTPSSNAVVVVRVPEKLGRPLRLPDGTVTFTAGDADGGVLSPADLHSFQAQVSTNLVNWEPLPNSLTCTNGMLLLRDPAGTNSPSRFYRIIEP